MKNRFNQTYILKRYSIKTKKWKTILRSTDHDEIDNQLKDCLVKEKKKIQEKYGKEWYPYLDLAILRYSIIVEKKEIK